MRLLPKNDVFFELLEQLANHMVACAEQLKEITACFPAITELVLQIANEEQTADHLTQSELKRLDDAFITPLDREDILHLMIDLYRVVETMARMAQRLQIYRLSELGPAFSEQIVALHQVVISLSDLIHQLRDGHQLAELDGKMRDLHCRKREADSRLRACLDRLFVSDRDPLDVIKRKDLYELIGQAIDDCENVSRTVQQVVLKNS